MDFFFEKPSKDEIYKGDEIIHLTKKDFKLSKKEKVTVNNKILNNKNGILIVYSPFCEVCKNHAENWEEYAQLLKNRFFVCVIDAYGPDGEITSYLNVKGYPTIFLIKLNGSLEQLPLLSMEEYFNIMLQYGENPV